MPDAQNPLDAAGGITKALLAALDLIQKDVSASQVGPDGKPSGTSIYMQLPMGITIDPTMYADPWTPAGGDANSSFNNQGGFIQTAAPATGAPAPTGPDQQLAQSIQNAFYTAALVDNMLQISSDGVAASWEDRQISIEYFTVLKGMQPTTTEAPDPNVVARVKAAQAELYTFDANGDPIGYTPLYNNYIRNRKAWTDAIGAQASAYWQAMSDPTAGRAWPVVGATYANAVKQALDDLNGMGRMQVEAALNTIATQGQDATTALIALANQLYDSFSIQLGGTVSVPVPWSYIAPTRWYDATDDSLGARAVTVTDASSSNAGSSGSSSFAHSWWSQQSSAVGGSVGIHFGPFGGSADASHTQASNASASNAQQAGWSSHTDTSSSATISFEYFVANIYRPWLLGDLFHIDGWYWRHHRKNDISDGTIAGQIGKPDKTLPMLPMAFVIMRNVSIKTNDWGDAGTDFTKAQQLADSSGKSSSSSFGGSVGFLGISGSANVSKQNAGGAFRSTQTNTTGFTFQQDGRGGTLTLNGSQIVGWIGQIQPASPQQDDPGLASLQAPSGTASSTQPAEAAAS